MDLIFTSLYYPKCLLNAVAEGTAYLQYASGVPNPPLSRNLLKKYLKKRMTVRASKDKMGEVSYK
jgi:hypothetical protein|tara:strand:+ start:1367 stop:1561 length:195 start_codon:yes stop_codon:yes gene_type:complete